MGYQPWQTVDPSNLAFHPHAFAFTAPRSGTTLFHEIAKAVTQDLAKLSLDVRSGCKEAVTLFGEQSFVQDVRTDYEMITVEHDIVSTEIDSIATFMVCAVINNLSSRSESIKSFFCPLGDREKHDEMFAVPGSRLWFQSCFRGEKLPGGSIYHSQRVIKLSFARMLHWTKQWSTDPSTITFRREFLS